MGAGLVLADDVSRGPLGRKVAVCDQSGAAAALRCKQVADLVTLFPANDIREVRLKDPQHRRRRLRLTCIQHNRKIKGGRTRIFMLPHIAHIEGKHLRSRLGSTRSE